jgi:hypothetical protein
VHNVEEGSTLRLNGDGKREPYMGSPRSWALLLQLETEATSSQPGKSSADLPADFTKNGSLLDVDWEVSGVPALRVCRVDVKLSPPQANGASGKSEPEGPFRVPTAEQLAHRDDTGAHLVARPKKCLACVHRLQSDCSVLVFPPSLMPQTEDRVAVG